MKVRVRLFAGLREVAGADHLDVELPSGTTVNGLWERLVAGNHRLAAYGNSIQFAINHDFVKRETELSPDDEIAFLPPVSGG